MHSKKIKNQRNFLRNLVVLPACLGLVAILYGCTAAGPQVTKSIAPAVDVAGVRDGQAVTSGDEVSAAHQLSSGDQLSIRFPENPSYDSILTVNYDGRVSLPFLGEVPVEGMTVESLRETIGSAYADFRTTDAGGADKQYLIQANDVLEIRFPYREEFTTDVVVRPDGKISLALIGSLVAENISPEKLQEDIVLAYKAHFPDPNLVVIVKEFSTSRYSWNGTVVDAPPSNLSQFILQLDRSVAPYIFIAGEVKQGGAAPLVKNTSALQAIVAAGGATRRGTLKNVVIIRRGPQSEPVYMVRNLHAELSGAASNDVLLKPFDIVVVPRSNIAKVNDVLDQYVYSILPTLRNSSIGYSYVRPKGTDRQEIITRTQ